MTERSSAEPIGVSRDEAAELLGLSLTAIDAFRHRSKFPLPSFSYGKRVVIPRRELVEWVADEAERHLSEGESKK